jgi:hypothetical protein
VAYRSTFDVPFDAACDAVREGASRWPVPPEPPPTPWERLLKRLGRTGEPAWRRMLRFKRSEPGPADLLAWLLAQPGDGLVDVSDYGGPRVMDWAAERLVASGQFASALCATCPGEAWFRPAAVSVEPFAYNDGFLASGSGRQWCCPNGHFLIAVLEFQSWTAAPACGRRRNAPRARPAESQLTIASQRLTTT